MDENDHPTFAGVDTFVRHQCGHQSSHLLPVESQVRTLSRKLDGRGGSEVLLDEYNIGLLGWMLFPFKDELIELPNPNLDIHLGNRFGIFLQLLFAFSDFEQLTSSRDLKLLFLVNLSQKQHESSLSAGQWSLFDHGWRSRVDTGFLIIYRRS